MIGLALGVAVLIVVLSVMNGLRGRIAHANLEPHGPCTISGLEGRLSDWRPQEEKLARFPG